MGKGTPFVGSEALRAGTFTERELRRFCTRIYRNVYQRRDSGLTAKDRAVAAWLWSGKGAVVTGLPRPRCWARNGSTRMGPPS